LAEYAEKDERIKIITNRNNLGLTRSLNRGIKTAKGEYIARQDADDISMPARFKKQAELLKSDSDIGLASCFAQFIDDKDRALEQKNLPKERVGRKELFFFSKIAHSSLMIRKTILDAAGGYDEKFLYSQDCDLAFKVIKIAKIASVPEILILWRNQKDSLSAKKRLNQIKFEMLAYIKAINSDLYPFYYYIFLPFLFVKSIIPGSIKKFLWKMKYHSFQ
jgi:GT2 family glycosyltransferase